MPRLILVALLFILFPFSLYAQSNYHEGLVVKNNNDTLKGYIDYKEWQLSPKAIHFKKNKTDHDDVVFTPENLKAFQIKGSEYYITYTGPVSTAKNSFPDLPSLLDTTTRLDTVFLKITYAGSACSLLVNTDEVKTRYFVMEKSYAPVELNYYQYYAGDNQVSATATSSPFRNQLLGIAYKQNILKDELSSKVARLNYTESDLISVLKFFNNDQDAQRLGKKITRYFIGAAFNHTVTEFKGNNMFVSGKQPVTNLPGINAGIDIFANPNTQRLIFRTELSLSYINPAFRYSDITGQPVVSDPRTYTFNQTTIKLLPQILFNFYNTDNLKVFIAPGLGINYSFYSDNKYTASNGENRNYYKLEKVWINFPVSAGAVINKRLDVFAKYAFSAAISDYTYFNINNKIYSLGLHYYLGNN